MNIPELGSKISLISKANIRYDGILFTVDTQEHTIALSQVQSLGTEDRPTEFKVPAQSQIYNYILFRLSEIKDIIVITSQIPLNDPAIIQSSVPLNSMSGFYSSYQPMNELGSVNLVRNTHNPMSDTNINVGLSHKQTKFLNLLFDVSRSSTPAQPIAFNVKQNSSTFDQNVQIRNQQSPGNVKGGKNQRNQSTYSSDTREQVMQQGQIYQWTNKNYKRNDQNYQRNDFQHQDNNQNFVNRHSGNRNLNGRNWNNHKNNRQQPQTQVRIQNLDPNPKADSSFLVKKSIVNRSIGIPALKAHGPKTNLLKFDEDYEFEKANSEFQNIIKKLYRSKFDDVFDDTNVDVAVVNGKASSVNRNSTVHINDGVLDTVNNSNHIDSENKSGVTENENEDDDHTVYYDKSKSFFDSVSYEAIDGNKGQSHRTDWRTERKLNSKTFGAAMAWHGRIGYYTNNYTNYRTNPNINNNNYNNNRLGVNYNYRQ